MSNDNVVDIRKGSRGKQPSHGRDALNEQKQDLADDVLTLAEKVLHCFADPASRAYAAYSAARGIAVVGIGTSAFEDMLRTLVRNELRAKLPSPVLRQVRDELTALARMGKRQAVEMRIAAGAHGQILIDLGDHQWSIIAVDSTGYRLHEPQHDSEIVYFQRPIGLEALPDPLDVPINLEGLRKFVNLASEGDWKMLVAWILFALRPKGPYPILLVTGSAGSSKSTFLRVVRSLVDPSIVPSQSIPSRESDMVIAGSNSHLLAFDNVRTLSVSQSDALCRIATGAGYRTRALYSDTGEVLIHVCRPTIINGICDVADQSDLLSRALHLDLPAITKKLAEAAFWQEFEAARPGIFAGLLNALAKTLAAEPGIPTEAPVRMADFWRFGLAVETALGWTAGSFEQAYRGNQRSAMEDILDQDPLARALIRYVKDNIEPGKGTQGTPTAVLGELADGVSETVLKNPKLWPRSAKGFGKRLRKLEPALRGFGVELKFEHSGTRKIAIINRTGE